MFSCLKCNYSLLVFYRQPNVYHATQRAYAQYPQTIKAAIDAGDAPTKISSNVLWRTSQESHFSSNWIIRSCVISFLIGQLRP